MGKVYYKTEITPSGKKYRVALDEGRVIEKTRIKSHAKGTKTSRRLARRRRRIGL